MEVRLLLRNGEQLLLAVVIPVLVLIGGVVGAERVGLDLAHQPVDELTPGVLALAILSTSFTSLAIATGFERRYGVLKRLGATPLPRSGLLGAKVLALLAVEVLQIAVLSGVALALGWAPEPGFVGLVGFVLAAVLGTAAFASLGLLLAGTLRAEATLAVANLVYLLFLAGGAVVLPTSSYGAFGDVARWLPSGALGDAVRAAFLEGAIDVPALLCLLLWAVVAGYLTSRTFKWE
jgi:ABC-2 type transport system permease protein